MIDEDFPETKETPEEPKELKSQLKFYEMGMDMNFNQPSSNDWDEEEKYYNHQEIGQNYDQNPNYPINSGMVPNSHYPSYQNQQANYNNNPNLFGNSSTSSIGNKEHNLSYSEDGDGLDYLNRTLSVRMFNPSCGMNSILNNSYESGGIIEDNEVGRSSRSFVSSNSRESNHHFASTCAKTFASSGGGVDHNNSQMQLTPNLQQMHSSFDLGNNSSYNGYNRLTPRQMSEFSFRSGQNYHPGGQFNSFHGFSATLSDLYNTIVYEGNNEMRNSNSVVSLDCGKAYSNPGVSYKELSLNSTGMLQRKKKPNNKAKGLRKRCPAKEKDQKLFTVNIDEIIEGRDKRSTLMIRNIPNKYNCQLLTDEINKKNRNRYDFFYLPIDYK